MKNRKGVLITIIVLLIIFLPLTVLGFIANLNNEENNNQNPNHDFMFEGQLWFYDDTDTLLGTYKCLTKTCGLSKSIINDDEYGIKYYKEGEKEAIEYDGSDYVILTDGTESFIYDIKGNKKFVDIDAIKTYNTILDGNLYIVKNNNKWGVVRIKNNANNDLNILLPFEYDFIGLKDLINEDNTLNTEIFIVSKDNKWVLLNQRKEEVSTGIDNPIIDYSDKFLMSQNGVNYIIYDYSGTQLYSEYVIDNYTANGDFMGFISNNVLYLYNGNTILGRYDVPSAEGKIELEVQNNNLNVKFAGNEVGNIALT